MTRRRASKPRNAGGVKRRLLLADARDTLAVRRHADAVARDMALHGAKLLQAAVRAGRDVTDVIRLRLAQEARAMTYDVASGVLRYRDDGSPVPDALWRQPAPCCPETSGGSGASLPHPLAA